MSLTACECDDDATDGGALPPETAVSANQLFWFLVSSGHLQSAAMASFILLSPWSQPFSSCFPCFSVRRSHSPLFFTPVRPDDGILPASHFSTCFSSPQFLRRSGSSLKRSGSPQKASSLPVSRLAPVTLGPLRPLSFSPLPSLSTAVSPFPHLPPVLPSLLLFLFLLPSPPLCPCLSRPFTLFFFTFNMSTQRRV